MLAWPLWALGFAVAIVFYVALGYLIFAGVRLGVTLARRGLQELKLARRSRDFGGEAFPTLLEVAASRVTHPRARASHARRHPERRAA